MRFVIQLACVDAVHAHSGWAVIVTEPVPPFPPSSLGEAATVTAHFTGEGLVVSAADPPQVADPADRTATKTGNARQRHADMGAGGNGAHGSTKISVCQRAKRGPADQAGFYCPGQRGVEYFADLRQRPVVGRGPQAGSIPLAWKPRERRQLAEVMNGVAGQRYKHVVDVDLAVLGVGELSLAIRG